MRYAVIINRPLQTVLEFLDRLDPAMIPPEDGLSFERVGGGTRISYRSARGPAVLYKLADLLLAQIAARDTGANVPELIFEPEPGHPVYRAA